MEAERHARLVAGLAGIVLFGAVLTVAGRIAAPGTSSATEAASPVISLPPPTTAPPPAPTVPPTTAPPPPVIPPSTELATPRGSIPTYASLGGAQNGEVGIWYGYSLTLPVVDDRGDWLAVRLPQRPNQATAWIHRSDADITSTPWHIVVGLNAELLTVYNAGRQVMQFGVGVGTPRTPTVTGAYFITVHAPPPNAAYGPFVLSTSAHSDAITSWEGAGDAIIAIHGPIDSYADSLIGTGRARVSNGCIRMHDRDLAQLNVIPIGTPLDITA